MVISRRASQVLMIAHGLSSYSKIAEEEDNKITQRWQKDGEGIIIFVCPSGFSHDSCVY